MSAISRGWALKKQSWAVARAHRPLAFLSVLSAFSSLVGLLALWTAVALYTGVCGVVDPDNPVFWVATASTCILTLFTGTFFNVALAACAARSLRGEDLTAVEGVATAIRLIGSVLGWTVTRGTVGVFLITARSSVLGREIEERITGATWDVAAFFVVSLITFERIGPSSAQKRSTQLVTATWGEDATPAGIHLDDLVTMGLAVIGGAGYVFLTTQGFSVFWFAVTVVGVASAVLSSIITSALNVIFRVAVYLYLVTGQAPHAFDATVVRGAFERKQ